MLVKGYAVNIGAYVWIIPVTLVVIAVIQFLYLLWLLYAPSANPNPRQPNEPILPYIPQSNIPTHDTVYPQQGIYPQSSGSIGKMIVLAGIEQREIPLPAPEFQIGRFYSPDAGILVALNDRSISRRHALFIGDDTLREYYLTDTNSSFGTYLQIENQYEKLQPQRKTRLYNEDVVKFGNNIIVRFVLPSDTRIAATRL